MVLQSGVGVAPLCDITTVCVGQKASEGKLKRLPVPAGEMVAGKRGIVKEKRVIEGSLLEEFVNTEVATEQKEGKRYG